MKKKLFLLMALLCCFVLAVGILAACNGNESEQPDVIDPNATYYTVTFDLNGGDGSIAPRDYAAGYKMELPTPTRDGYRFVGWQDAFGEKFDNSSLMPDNDLILYAQWEPVVTSYEDEFVYFKPATEGVKDPDTKLEYDDLDLTGFVYVELTSDMLGGRHKVGEENNFDFTRGVEMEYSVKSGYTLQWWRDRDFSVANGAQRFTLNYGSNFQFLTVSSNQQTRATYLIDFYVLHDYQVKLHTNIYDENPHETVWVIENRTFASDTEAYQMKDFEFDKRVYWDEDAGWGEWKAFDYSTPITQDWDLYQTYKPYSVEAELDGGTLDGELSIIPYTEYQQLPVPEKEGYDFIGWQLPDAENDKEDYFADITGFNSTLLLGGGRSTRTNVYFDTLTAVWLPKHYHKVTDGDEVSFEETVPVVTYTDRSMSEINEVIYVVKGTPYVLPEKVVYEGSLEFCGWKVWTQDNGGDYYGETFDFDAEVTEPAAMWQDMEVIGGSSSVKGLYLNDSRTFSSLGTGQRIEAYLPAQGDYTFTVTTTGTVNFNCNGEGHYATSSKPVTFTVTNEKPYDGMQVFLDVASYTGSFTIKFEGPTGTAEAPSESIADAVYAVGDAVTAPQKSGYTFVGWYDADGTKLSEEGSFDFAMPAFDPDAVYTAKWQRCATKLAVNDADAGSVSGLEGTTVVGGEVTVTAETNPGYTFIGWYNGDEKVADTLTYEFTMSAENVTYTAKWVIYTVSLEKTDGGIIDLKATNSVCASISFDLNGAGGIAPLTQIVTSEVGLVYPEIPVYRGHVFAGWYDNPEGVGSPFDFSAPVTGDRTLYAKWVSYSGSDVIPYNGSLTVDVLSKDSSTKHYYAFVPLVSGRISIYSNGGMSDTYGSLYDSNKNRLAYDDDSGDGNNFKITYSVTAGRLYYIVPAGYNGSGSTTVYLSGDMPAMGGTYNLLDGEPIKITAGETVELTAETNPGHTFIGWYNGDVKVADGLTYEFTMPAENVTYTAKWIKVVIESEDETKGTVSELTEEYLLGDEVSVTATTKSGYTFIGWYNGDEKVADTLTYEFEMPAESVTYTAKWIKVTIASESTNKGTVSSLTDTYIFGEKVSVTATTNLGYTFIGWYDGDEKVADVLTYEFTMPAENATYTAKWMLNAEMEPFTFTSTPTSLTITGVTDKGVTSLDLPSDVTSIGSSAFSGCSSLTSVNIPDSVTSIGSSAFEDCSNLTSVNIPDGVTSIGSSTFFGCSSLISATIPDSVTSIGGSAFEDCSSLTSVNIPDGVTSIGSSTFSGCSGLTSITIPDSVTSIGGRAFEDCSSLTSITIPDSVTSIGGWAFYGCGGLTGVYITDIAAWCEIYFSDSYSNPLYWAHDLYLNGEEVTDLVIPDSVTSIGERAFAGCIGLSSVTISDGVTSIGNYAFDDCFNLTSITIPKSVTSIGIGAFSGCSRLRSVTIPNSVTSIRDYVFNGCSDLISVIIPNSVTSIGSAAFRGCTNLSVITIPKSVTSIGKEAFSGCTGLKSVVIPDGVTSIESSAFNGCTWLNSVTIPDSVTSIGERAFQDCGRLTSITIPANVTSIGSYAFDDCTGLTSVTFKGTKAKWNAITKMSTWKYGCTFTKVVCSNGTVSV